jgi:hypothetical protein
MAKKSVGHRLSQGMASFAAVGAAKWGVSVDGLTQTKWTTEIESERES